MTGGRHAFFFRRREAQGDGPLAGDEAVGVFAIEDPPGFNEPSSASGGHEAVDAKEVKCVRAASGQKLTARLERIDQARAPIREHSALPEIDLDGGIIGDRRQQLRLFLGAILHLARADEQWDLRSGRRAGGALLHREQAQSGEPI